LVSERLPRGSDSSLCQTAASRLDCGSDSSQWWTHVHAHCGGGGGGSFEEGGAADVQRLQEMQYVYEVFWRVREGREGGRQVVITAHWRDVMCYSCPHQQTLGCASHAANVKINRCQVVGGCWLLDMCMVLLRPARQRVVWWLCSALWGTARWSP
jgi:hypothetical protein